MTNKKNNLDYNTKKIAIRCLTISEKGYGNFSRCLNIAKSLREKNIQIYFLVDYNKSISKILQKNNFKFISKNKFQHDSKFVLNFLYEEKIDNIIIDMREKSENISKFLFKNNFKSILFDDAWCKNVYSDILFNGTNVKDYHKYKKINKNSKLFLNTKYWIINENFLYFRKKLLDIKEKQKYHIVISMGGVDPNNLTLNVVNSIKDIKIINITIIVGPLFDNLSQLNKIIKSYKNIKLIKSSNEIWKDLSKADVAITNGGNTLFESCALSIPTLSIPAFKHEVKYSEAFMKENFCVNLGLREINQEKINSNLLNLLENTLLRKKMFYSGKKIIDGKGLLRVQKIILNSLI